MYIQNIFILQTFCVLFINDAVTSILYLQILQIHVYMDVFQIWAEIIIIIMSQFNSWHITCKKSHFSKILIHKDKKQLSHNL